MNDNLIDKLDEIGMLYFVIVSLFSAETLVDVESCEVSLKGIEMLRTELPTSKYKDDPDIMDSYISSIDSPLYRMSYFLNSCVACSITSVFCFSSPMLISSA